MIEKITADNFTPDQQQAVDMIIDWYKNSSKREFRLAGFAGTGKSSLISLLPTILKSAIGRNIAVGYAAFTGKAAKVLRDKNIPAVTIHSMIYDATVFLNQDTGLIEHQYALKQRLDFDLIIIDEASMVSNELYQDLIFFGIKIIFVGDSGQLPPVESSLNLMNENFLDFTLQKIHRQATDSNIIKISVAIRNGDNITDHQTSDTAKMRFKDFKQEDYLKFDQIITGKNTSRVSYNKTMRQLRGLEGEEPLPKDKMIFLRNNREAGVFNGQQFVVTGVKKIKNGFFIHYNDIDDLKSGEASGKIWGKCINSTEPVGKIKFNKGEFSKDLLQSDFSYCITGHKSQGSQWPAVLLADDRFGYWDQDFRRKWLYTVVTRAQKKLLWLY